MSLHRQFAVPHLILSVVMVCHILEELVGRSETHLNGSVLLLCVVAKPIGGVLAFLLGVVLKGTASVATRTDIFHSDRHTAFADVGVYLAEDICIVRQIFVPILVNVVSSWLIDGIDLAAVHTLPDTEMRQGVVSRRAPPELGRMEASLPGMTHEGWQSVGEAETVRQHHIVAAAHTKLFLVETVGIEHAVQDAFGRRHHHIACIDGHTAHVPLPVLDVLLHLLELLGIVFLHPHVLDGPLVIESEAWVLGHERHIIHQSVLDILGDCSLDVPVPLCVEMGVGDEEESLFILGLTKHPAGAKQDSG